MCVGQAEAVGCGGREKAARRLREDGQRNGGTSGDQEQFHTQALGLEYRRGIDELLRELSLCVVRRLFARIDSAKQGLCDGCSSSLSDQDAPQASCRRHQAPALLLWAGFVPEHAQRMTEAPEDISEPVWVSFGHALYCQPLGGTEGALVGMNGGLSNAQSSLI